MTSHRPRILYYCQSLVGIGHLTASLQIIQSLSECFDVDLIYGGLPYSSFPQLPGFRALVLPSLLLDADGEIHSPDAALGIEEAWQLRRHQISVFIGNGYAAAVFEFYPFGRRRFKKEIREIIHQVRAVNPETPLFSQIREILVPTDAVTERVICDELNSSFHSVLVRGDPSVITLDETFSLAPALGDRLFYAGYVSPPANPASGVRHPEILVSQGGGHVGKDLLVSVIRAAPLLPVYDILVAAGSGASEEDLKFLQNHIESDNVCVVPFLPDFRQRLSASCLSINMGGDNTLLDVIATRTPSLAYPYPGNGEQGLRIAKLAAQGWVTPLDDAELTPVRLAAKIRHALSVKYPNTTINLNGAINIRNKIKSVLQNQ
jgi:predicted glycosyltransferase